MNIAQECDWNNVNCTCIIIYRETPTDPGKGTQGATPPSGPVKYAKKKRPPRIAVNFMPPDPPNQYSEAIGALSFGLQVTSARAVNPR